MGVTGGEPLGFNLGVQGTGGTLPGLDLVTLTLSLYLPVASCLQHSLHSWLNLVLCCLGQHADPTLLVAKWY